MRKKNNFQEYPKKLFYLIGLIFVLSILDFVFIGARYIQLLLTIALVWIFIQKIPNKGPIFRAFIIFTLIFLALIFRGLYLTNYPKYFFNDIYVWSFYVFVLFFSAKDSLAKNKLIIPALFAKLLMISIPFTIFISISYGSLSSDVLSRTLVSEDMNTKALFNPLLFAPLIMPFLFDLKKYLRVVVVLSNLLLFVFGVLSATRVAMFVPLMGFISFFYQFKHKSFSKSFSVMLVFILFLGVVSILLPQEGVEFFSEKMDYTLSRFENTDISSGRNSEVEGLFDEFTWAEFVLGRGAGGAQEFGFWKDTNTAGNFGVPLAHYGFLHLILKGGIPLLIFIYGLAIWSIINLFRRGDRQYFFVILIYLVYEISYQKFSDPFYVIFLWISISYSLQLKNQNSKLNRAGTLINADNL